MHTVHKIMLDQFWSMQLLFGLPILNLILIKLESVQRRAARYVMSDFNRYSSVSQRHFISFTVGQFEEKTRYHMCSLQNSKWVNSVSLPGCMSRGHNQGHNKRFVTISSKVNSYKFSFFPRVISHWNALSSDTVNAPTLQQFSTLLHR